MNDASKTVLITGANKGIGLEVAKKLGKQGYHIVLTSRNESKGLKALSELEAQNSRAFFVQMDVSDPESIKRAFSKVKNKISSLAVLINNAGVLLDSNISILDVPPEKVTETIHINALGALWVTQTFMPLLNSGSRIIMVSSGGGTFCGEIATWSPIYCVSKTLMNAFTKQLHASLKDQGMVINAMCPGWTQTDMGGSGATRKVSEGAETIVWLVTDAPKSINGMFLRDKKQISW
ncbi:MAG: SDR family NAD(P)-dependent oxidoreductase [Flavobacteriaceae bacterium]|nr:SDR family NAD(P)-dependent oxidoreductase [Flavobacteriaceae bacterium]